MKNDIYNQYEMTIGIECHVQLSTDTKLFSSADNDARDKVENSCLSFLDLAFPGTLPVLNEKAVVFAIRASKALNAKLNPNFSFDRKHYFYPDLPKGYQITQNYHPIIGAGYIDLPNQTRVHIEHAHLEEDAGKLNHYQDHSEVDLNRAGTPLIEIVSMPDIHSAKDASEYCKELWRALTFAKVTHGDLYHGNMRFDVNISVAKKGSAQLGTRTEIKNLNSFRSVERAADYEFKRQVDVLERGEKVIQETRGWLDDAGKTVSQREKSSAADYRYLPDPDIPEVELTKEFIDDALSKMPLLPKDYRLIFQNKLSNEALETLLDHENLISTLAKIDDILDQDQDLTKISKNVIKKLSNLFTSVLLSEEYKKLLEKNLPSPHQFITLAVMNENGELSSTGTKELLLSLFNPKNQDKDPKNLACELSLIQTNDTQELEKIIDQVLLDPATKQAQFDFLAGETKTLGFLIGQVMKASKGTANPQTASKIIQQKLKK